jgi:hypothetical protein
MLGKRGSSWKGILGPWNSSACLSRTYTSPAIRLGLVDRGRNKVVQIGGNETVGHGLYFWTLWSGD